MTEQIGDSGVIFGAERTLVCCTFREDAIGSRALMCCGRLLQSKGLFFSVCILCGTCVYAYVVLVCMCLLMYCIVCLNVCVCVHVVCE